MKGVNNMLIPKRYRRNAQTKLLYLYKTGYVSYTNYCKAKEQLMK